MTGTPSSPGARSAVALCAGATMACVGVAALLGWSTGTPLLASGVPNAVPVAPATAVLLGAEGVALALLARAAPRARALALAVCVAGVGVVALAVLRMAGLPLANAERLFFEAGTPVHGAAVGLLSPLTVVAFGLTTTALGLLLRGSARSRAAAVAPGLAAGLLGAAVLVGYAYRAPLLYDTALIPMALPTGLGFTAAGVALVALAGSAAWPVRAFVGTSVRARLLRAFVPLGTAVVLIHGGLSVWAVRATSPVLVSVGVALGTAALTGWAVAELAGAIGAAIRLAEERRLHAERERAKLVEGDRLREEWAAMIVHDLKNPLAIVLANLGLLRAELEPERPDAEDALADAEAASHRMKRLLSNLLDVYRLEAGEVVMQPVPTDVTALLETVTARTRSAALHRSIAVVRRNGRGGYVTADPDALTRVLENLLDNGLRHTPAGGRIELTVEPAERTARIRVGNTGPPIPEPSRTRVFDKYVSSRQEGRLAHQGLGLYFCRLAVEALGGKIWVEETAALPTVFCIELPLAADLGAVEGV
ncbi:MAG: HAMP domain-containing histidine kinase [Polyangiaceae bacterium]|nr:HAMP domain-containing histidine kinase [Polyangiaceae bacterium]